MLTTGRLLLNRPLRPQTLVPRLSLKPGYTKPRATNTPIIRCTPISSTLIGARRPAREWRNGRNWERLFCAKSSWSSGGDQSRSSRTEGSTPGSGDDAKGVSAIWKWIGGGIAGLLLITAPWTIPILQLSQRIVTADDEIEFERSKHNCEVQIDYQRAMRDQVLVEDAPKTWFDRQIFKLRTILRILQLGLLITPLALLGTFAVILPFVRPWWWQLLHETIDTAGGCWIKLGQWATTRPDIFPRSMLSQLDYLQDQCSPHSLEETRAIIRENYNAELEDLFDDFGKTPIAVGAIAQVYHARLKLTGEEVAVKVLHPNIQSSLQIDLNIMGWGASILSLLPGMEWCGLNDAIEQFGSTMLGQVDMRFEARNLMRFGQNFAGDPNVVFPKVIDKMSTKQVLVETFEFGQPLTAFLNSASEPEQRRKLAHIGLRSFLTMLLVHNFIHADMHPGNLMVRKDPKTDKLQLVILDVGLICELSEFDWLNFKMLFKCIVKGDGKAGADLMVEHAPQAKITPENRVLFTEEMNELFTHLRAHKLSDIDIGIFLSQMLDVVRRYKVRVNTNVTTLVVGTVVLEGIGRQLDSDINILDQSIPFLIWSEKATLQDRLIFIREKVRDEFERDDSKDTPLATKMFNLFGKPLIDSMENFPL